MMYYDRCALNPKQFGVDSNSNDFHHTATTMIALREPKTLANSDKNHHCPLNLSL